MTKGPLLSLSALSLAACASTASEPQVIRRGAGECRSETLAQFTGQTATQELGAEMLRVSGAKVLQWIAPGMMVTMEYRSDRVRVQLAPGNKIEAARCG